MLLFDTFSDDFIFPDDGFGGGLTANPSLNNSLNLTNPLSGVETITSQPLNSFELAQNTILDVSGVNILVGTSGSDQIFGLARDDLISGAEADDLLFGNEGADTVYGHQDNDTIYGGSGADLLFGGQGDDLIAGDQGNDTIYGNKGTDILIGGQGENVFVLEIGSGGYTVETTDLIVNFNPSEDRLELPVGLTFEDLRLEQTPAGDTAVRDTNSGEMLALLQGVSSDSLTEDRFIQQVETESNPPINEPISLSLANDTGLDNQDNITSDPTLTGRVANPAEVAGLEISIGEEFVPISTNIDGEGSFTLTQQQLEETLGISFVDGIYTVELRTVDAAGLRSPEIAEITFTIAPDDNNELPGELLPPGTDIFEPTITAELANDTGTSDSDGITSDPTITGTATDNFGVAEIEVSIGEEFVPISTHIAADGSFILTPNQLEEALNTSFVDGSYTVFLRAVDTSGLRSPELAEVNFTLDSEPPEITAQLANDTGENNSDGITTDPTITGTATDNFGVAEIEVSIGEEFVPISTHIADDGSFTLTPNQLEEALNISFVDGSYTVFLRAVDPSELRSPELAEVNFTLDGEPPEITAQLANDTGENNSDGITTDPTITGTVSDDNEIVAFRAGFDGTLTNISSQLNADGSFTLNPTELEAVLGDFFAEGSYSLQLEAEDELGQVSEETIDFTLDVDDDDPPVSDDDDDDDDDVVLSGSDFTIDMTEVPGFDLLEEPLEVEEGIFFLGTGPSPDELNLLLPSNTIAADTTNADQLWDGGELGLDLSGNGITVGVWDGGNVLDTHQEFGSRVVLGENSPGGFSDHATHVAGTIAASGVNPDARGMANQVQIISFDNANDLAEIEAATSQDQLYLSNHSYGPSVGWDSRMDWGIGLVDTWWGDLSLSTESSDFGKYSDPSAELDRILYENPELLSIWGAGNERSDDFQDLYRRAGHKQGISRGSAYVTFSSQGPAGEGWYQIQEGVFAVDANTSLVSPPPPDNFSDNGYDTLNPSGKTAKNTLVVGAINDITNDPYDSGDVSISSFSSWGPTDDGRVKPDVVANGVDVFSPVAESDTSYNGKFSGTSMAAPNVTGTAALLYEHYNDLFGELPNSATGKALLIHTASDAGNVGPDYVYGWGVVDGSQAANFLTNVADGNPDKSIFEETFTGGQLTADIEVQSANTPVKATLVWTDPAGQPQSGLDDRTSVLVNDLDLWITDEEGTIYNPWTLNPENPTAPAQQDERNIVDNVEQVFFDTPSEGTYTIHVGSRTGETFTQNFSLLVSEGSDVPPVGTEPPPEDQPPVEPPENPNPDPTPPADPPELPPIATPQPPITFTGVDLYQFGYFYGSGDAYYGYTYAPSGTYFPGEVFVDSFLNETFNGGFYQIGNVFPGWGNDATNGDVYVTSYFDGDFTGLFYQPYNNFFGLPSGELGLGSEYDYIYKNSFFGPYYDDFGLRFYSA
ncbi:Ig-like domain-containing protein [Capilliphycus salinus ALCB114379]|uniref:Ig-like domain-containing protein n=1 Tax=Capilliphycus salinus TaxID=2768948 RepID=UPI0039A69C81